MTRRLARHPQALAVLRAVRDGRPIASVPDSAAALASLTCGAWALRLDGDTYRLTMRGRELLALAGVVVRRPVRFVRVRVVGASIRSLLELLVEGMAAWSWLSRHGVEKRVLARAAQGRLVERYEGCWRLTERGRRAAATGVVETTEVYGRVVWKGEVTDAA